MRHRHLERDDELTGIMLGFPGVPLGSREVETQRVLDLGVGKPVVGFTTNFYRLAGAAWEKMYKGELPPAAALQEVYDQQMKNLGK